MSYRCPLQEQLQWLHDVTLHGANVSVCLLQSLLLSTDVTHS